MNDQQAFTTYLEERVLRTLTHGLTVPGQRFMGFSYQGQDRTISLALYKEFRCNLIHEAELPAGVHLEAADRGLSISISDDELVLGAGWLRLLWEALINDPGLQPMFDDIRRKGPHDLKFTAPGDAAVFDSDFIEEFRLSPGRLDIIKRFIANFGSGRLRQMSDADFRDLWEDEVTTDPARFGLDETCMIGLSNVGADYMDADPLMDRASRSFHRADFVGRSAVYTMNERGLQMLRALIDAYET